MPLIHGKQLRPNTITEELLLVTGSTATNGQLLAYDSGSGGFTWVNDAGGVTSIIAGNGLSGNSTTGNVTLVADVDNNSIFIDEANKISLGDPTTGDIGFPSGGTYTFVGGSNHVIFEGDFTVNGTSTFLNTDNLAVKDNIIMINSGSTVGFGTAGISVDLGNGSFSDILWHEANGGYWAIDNPGGSGSPTTYPIITTNSLASADNTIVITQGTGINIDTLDLVVDESNFSNIPNSALTNSSINISDDGVVTGDTSVSLGGTLNIGLAQDSIKEVHLNATNSATDNYLLSYDSGSGGFTWVDVDAITTDTYVTGGTLSGNNIILERNDGQTVSIDISASDFNDTYVTGGTISNGSLTLNTQDTTVNVSGTIIETVTGDSPITASTSNGDVTVGIDYSTLQSTTPTKADKKLTVTATTTGDAFNTGISIAATPARDSYVGVSVNGVWYIVGDSDKTPADVDCYFSDDGGTTPLAIENITSGSVLFWNGDGIGFQIDTNDNVALYYDILQ